MSKDNKTKQELQCEIVQDILPLYHDGVVSDVTHQAVSEHLEGCEVCTREYKNLCEELPQKASLGTDQSITKSKFEGMKKKLKKKQVIITMLVSLALCISLIIAGHVLTQVPLVPVSDDSFEVKAVYKVEIGDKTKVFFAYTSPIYNGTIGWNAEVVESSEDELVLTAGLKRTIFSKIINDLYYPIEVDMVSIEDDMKNIQKITLGGKVVWTEEENGKDEIPEYVYEYDKCKDSPGADIFMEDEYVSIYYDYDREVRWDYDGNIIYDGEILPTQN